MKLFYPNIDLAVAVGDIHGLFKELVFNLINRYQFKNTLVIICGDVGMGFHRDNYYYLLFEHLNKKLAEHNVTLIGLRGNHDNPKWFDGKMCDYSHIKMVPDYTLIQIREKHGLLIGGARSIDRVFWDKFIQKFRRRELNVDFWIDEVMQPLNMEFLSNLNVDIDYIFTHSRPSCIVNHPKFIIAEDLTFEEDIKNEEKILNGLVAFFQGDRIIKWFNGHFHDSGVFSFNNILLNSLGIMEIKEII